VPVSVNPSVSEAARQLKLSSYHLACVPSRIHFIVYNISTCRTGLDVRFAMTVVEVEVSVEVTPATASAWYFDNIADAPVPLPFWLSANANISFQSWAPLDERLQRPMRRRFTLAVSTTQPCTDIRQARRALRQIHPFRTVTTTMGTSLPTRPVMPQTTRPRTSNTREKSSRVCATRSRDDRRAL